MNNWLLYILEANVYMAVFYAFYCLVLKRETFSTINRWFLLGSSTVAFILPLIKAERVVFHNMAIAPVPTDLNDRVSALTSHLPVKAVAGVQMQSPSLNYAQLLTIACLAISFILIVKLALDVLSIVKLYRRSEKFCSGGIKHVLLKEKKDVFSFLNWLFYHSDFKGNQAILTHELVHIRQKHSVDVLFFRLLCAINWFNPVFRYLLTDVRSNHEFIADEIAATKCATKYHYATLLIDYADSNNAYTLAHAMFSSNQLKTRINYLAKKRSPKTARLKLLIAAPLLMGALFISAFKIPKEYGVFSIRLKEQAVKIAPYTSPAKTQTVKQYAIKAPRATAVLQQTSSPVKTLPVSETIISAKVYDLSALNDMYDRYMGDLADLNGQLADMLSSRDLMMENWWSINDGNAPKSALLEMKRRDATLLSDTPPMENITVAAEYFTRLGESEKGYLSKIEWLMKDYHQFQVVTSKQFKFNTTDPDINKQYYVDRYAKQKQVYKELEQLFSEVHNNLTESAAYSLQLAIINFKIYCKRDEINDKQNERNGIVRARNLLVKTIT